jgi:hypothetical protein
VVESDQLDQRPDLRLGAAQQDRASAAAKAARQHRQVKHQRRVREDQLAQLDDDVGFGSERTGERTPAPALGTPILVAGASQDRRVVSELDDRAKLQNPADGGT